MLHTHLTDQACGYQYMTQGYIAVDEGNTLGGIEAMTLAECEESCDSTNGCRSFTYGNLNDNTNCWLKDKIITESEPTTYNGYWTTYFQRCSDGKPLQCT